MEDRETCASDNGADRVICELFGPNWKDALLTKEGKTVQICERCGKCQRTKPE